MYWKKKADKPDMFEYETNSRRSYVRVSPSKDKPVVIRFETHDIPAGTISAGGLSFQNSGFTKGAVFPITFNLPGFAASISASIAIADICRDDVCHCTFTDMGEEERELLHQYCLARQKEAICLSAKELRQVT